MNDHRMMIRSLRIEWYKKILTGFSPDNRGLRFCGHHFQEKTFHNLQEDFWRTPSTRISQGVWSVAYFWQYDKNEYKKSSQLTRDLENFECSDSGKNPLVAREKFSLGSDDVIMMTSSCAHFWPMYYFFGLTLARRKNFYVSKVIICVSLTLIHPFNYDPTMVSGVWIGR